ncbi:MAG: MMPL family transporter [Myxococcota bacterium]|nr:MMPL family transporter [Myxococcota bacterium]
MIDAHLSRAVRTWVDAVQPRARAISWMSVALTLALGTYAALELRINSDNVKIVASTLPSMVAQAEFSRFFPNLDDALLIVVDGETTEQTREAAEALVEELSGRTESFTSVYVPGGGTFFERNGLMYRSPDELDLFADQMARVQPVLAQLELDPSIASLSNVIRLGLDAVRREEDGGAEWAGILDQVGNATVTIFDEFPVAVSWEEVLLRGSSLEVTNRRVIVAHPILDFGNALAAGSAIAVIRSSAAELGYVPERGVRVRVTGNPALNYEEMIGLAWDIGGAGAFCFLLVCTVLYAALRSFRLMVASVLTLLMGLVWTAGFATFAVHQLNILSLTFAVLFIGLGIDFAIHLGMRYMNLLHRGVPHERAISTAAGDVGPSLVICTVTTAIGFYVFLPSDYRGVAELGLIAGTGMFFILFLTVTTLPALLGGWLHLGEDHSQRREVRFKAGLLHVLSSHGRWVRWASVVATVVGLGLIYRPGAHFDSNVVRMRNPETESVQAFNDLMSVTITSPWYANALTPDLAAAQKLAESFRKIDIVEQVITLADFVPTDQEDKLEILGDVAMLLATPTAEAPSGKAPTVDEQIESLRELEIFLTAGWVDDSRSALGQSMRLLRTRIRDFLERIEPESDPAAALDSLEKVLLSNLPRQVQRLRDAVMAEEISQEDLPAELVERMLAPTGEARVQIFPREDLQEGDALERFVLALRQLDPYVSGVSVNLFDFGRATVSSFQQAIGLAFVLISLLLYGLWRNWADVALVLAPLLLGAIVTVATMAALGVHFTFANVIVLPLLFGVGVDSGIHLVHRAKIHLKDDEFLMGTTTARAVFYSALTTVTSFGTLAFSTHRGVAGLGMLLTLGMLLMVVCNLIVLPALIELRAEEPE